MPTFSAQVSEHVRRYKRRMEFVFKQSAQDVIGLAQAGQPSVKVTGGSFEIGAVPVDTGFLINSLTSGLNGQYGFDGKDSYLLAIAGAELGDSIQAGWTASYALDVEYGNAFMEGRFFVRANAQKWQQIVDENAAQAMSI